MGALATVGPRLPTLLEGRTVAELPYLGVKREHQAEITSELGRWRRVGELDDEVARRAGHVPGELRQYVRIAKGKPDWREPPDSLRRWVEEERVAGRAVLLAGNPLPPVDPESYLLVYATHFYDVVFPGRGTQPYVLYEPEAGWWHSSQSGELSAQLLTGKGVLLPLAVVAAVLGGSAAIWLLWARWRKHVRKGK
jgi:hypothetical protein